MPADRPALPHSMRLDKWLWCARFYKTRSLAAEAIRAGRVQADNKRCKPSRAVKPGDEIDIRQGPCSYRIRILQMTRNRQSAAAAAELYSEDEASKAHREETLARLRASAALQPRTRGRPTKKERRDLIKFFRDPD